MDALGRQSHLVLNLTTQPIALEPEIAKLAQAFANPLRIRILELLAQGERSVDEIKSSMSAPLTTVSSQLQVLRHARLVESRREGPKIHYRVAEESVLSALVELRRLAEARSLEAQDLVRDFLANNDDLEHVDSNRLFEMMHAGKAVLIDVRPLEEFEAGHIPGAVSLPLDDLTTRISQLPRDARIVAYCRDAYCVLAPQAVRAMSRFGLTTERLEIGFTEWVAGGRPVEVTAGNHERGAGGA